MSICHLRGTLVIKMKIRVNFGEFDASCPSANGPPLADKTGRWMHVSKNTAVIVYFTIYTPYCGEITRIVLQKTPKYNFMGIITAQVLFPFYSYKCFLNSLFNASPRTF